MAEAEEVDMTRSDEDQLRSLIKKDIDPEITAMAKNALQTLQEEDSS